MACILAPEEIPVGKRYFLFSKGFDGASFLASCRDSFTFVFIAFLFLSADCRYIIHRQQFSSVLRLSLRRFLSLSVFFISAVFIFLRHGYGEALNGNLLQAYFLFPPLCCSCFLLCLCKPLWFMAVTIGALLVSAKQLWKLFTRQLSRIKNIRQSHEQLLNERYIAILFVIKPENPWKTKI